MDLLQVKIFKCLDNEQRRKIIKDMSLVDSDYLTILNKKIKVFGFHLGNEIFNYIPRDKYLGDGEYGWHNGRFPDISTEENPDLEQIWKDGFVREAIKQTLILFFRN